MFGTYNIKRYYQDMRNAPLIYDMKEGFASHIRGEKAERKPPTDIVTQLANALRQDRTERTERRRQPVPPPPQAEAAVQTDAPRGSMARARQVDAASRVALGGLPRDVADTTRAMNITAETILPEHAEEKSAAVRGAHDVIHREALSEPSTPSRGTTESSGSTGSIYALGPEEYYRELFSRGPSAGASNLPSGRPSPPRHTPPVPRSRSPTSTDAGTEEAKETGKKKVKE